MDEFTLFALEAGSDQLHLTARVDRESGSATATAENICAAAESALDSYGMRILNERVFGTLDFYPTYARIRRKHRQFERGPCSYIQGTPVHGQGLSGIQIHAVKPFSDENPRVLCDGKRPWGSVWKRQDTTYVHIAGLHGLQKGSRSRGDQAASMFEGMKRLLASRSIDFRNVVRTWIYLDDILEWYDVFNAVRRERFLSYGLIPSSAGESSGDPVYLPASTGIGRGGLLRRCSGGLRAGSGFCSFRYAAAVRIQLRFRIFPGNLH